MENPFQTSELLKSASNYPVLKGDKPGHLFHGNQYKEGEGAVNTSEAEEASLKAYFYRDHANAEGMWANIQQQHYANGEKLAAEAAGEIAAMHYEDSIEQPEDNEIPSYSVGAYKKAIDAYKAAVAAGK